MGNQIRKLKSLSNEDIDDFSFNKIETFCKVVDVYDGDTCRIVFYYKKDPIKIKIRSYGYNCPEIYPRLSEPNREDIMRKAVISRNRLIELVTDCKLNNHHEYTKNDIKDILKNNKKIIYMSLLGFGKYGRVLGKFYLDKKKKQCVNDMMIKDGYAIEYQP